MKIISLGLDKSVFNKNSKLVARLIDQSSFLDAYLIFVPNYSDQYLELNNKIKIYGVSGRSKIVQLIHLYRKLIRTIDKSYHIITVQDNYYLALLGWLISRKYNLKLEIQVHGFEKIGFVRHLIFKFVIKRS